MTLTRIKPSGINTAALNALTAGPAVANIQIANSTYGILDDTALSTSGGFIVINGSKFASGCTVLVGNTPATSVSFVSATQLRAQIPAKVSGTYVVYISNPDGGTAIFVNGVTCSNVPVWSTGSTLANGSVDTALSINLSASSDSNVTYTVAAGSSLPSGVTLASNGLLSGTVTGITNETTYNFTVVATDVEFQDVSRAFSITIAAGDANYKDTVLHLNGEVASNTWITDASTNKATITVNGDTRPVGFSPYETVWSNFFDGTGDLLTGSATNTSDFGTGQYTIEAWVYFNSLANFAGIYIADFYFGLDGSQRLAVGRQNVGFDLFATVPPSNQWVHLAASRDSSNNTRLFINGSVVASQVVTTSYGNASFVINRADAPFAGYISNLRIVKGTALYTSTFTPSTSPLTAIANTSLLTCQSNRLIDNSTNNITITRTGDVSVSNFGPFTETDITTGSGYFDGTGDYLTFLNSSSFAFGTGNFTVEFWINAPLNNDKFILGGRSASSFFITTGGFGGSTAGALRYNDNVVTSGSTLITDNSWHHCAIVRNSGTVTLYVDGISRGTGTDTTNYTTTSGDWKIGSNDNFAGSNILTGYISNLRILKGTALYTSTFTPPTSPLTAIANTSLLVLQSRVGENNNRFIDTSGLNNIITRNGNVTQGTSSPFSHTGWSNFFDGTGDFLTLPSNAAFSFGTGSFTVEAWVYITATQNFGIIFLSSTTGTGDSLHVQINSTNRVRVTNASTEFLLATNAIPLNAWTHIAVVRNGTTLSIYQNGVLNGSTTNSTNFIENGATVGYEMIGGNYYFTGHISNLRVVKGTAVYTSAFTPPTSPLTAITNTSLLTCQSNRFIDNSTNNFTITRNGDVSVESFSPMRVTNSWSASVVGGSVYFDGTGDYLTAPRNSLFFPGASTDFTIEAWVYPISFPDTTHNSHQLIGVGEYGTRESTDWAVAVNSSRTVSFYLAATNLSRTTSATVNLRSWNHIAVSRSGSGTNNLTIYVNGVGQSFTETGAFTHSGSSLLSIGADTNGDEGRMHGYLSGLRMINGRSIYSGSPISIPTAPPTPIAGTVFLLSDTNAGIIDYTSKNNLETVGDVRVRNNIVKYGDSSMFFDGSDEILTRSSRDFDYGTGDFTIEMWVNIVANPGSYSYIYAQGPNSSASMCLYIQGGVFRVWNGSAVIVGSTSYLLNTWYHVAISRSGTSLRLFLNGVQDGSTTNNGNITSGSTFGASIGRWAEINDPGYFTGYIDDLRVTKGVARYTANFTPPTSAFFTR